MSRIEVIAGPTQKDVSPRPKRSADHRILTAADPPSVTASFVGRLVGPEPPGDRHRHAHDTGLLEGIGTNGPARHLPRDGLDVATVVLGLSTPVVRVNLKG